MTYTARELNFDNPAKKRLGTGEDYGFLLVTHGAAHVSDTWKVSTDEFLVCKPHQALMIEHPGGRYPLSAIWVRVPQELLRTCSTAQTDLPASFSVNPEPIALIRSSSELLMLIKSLASRLITLPREADRYGADLFEEGTVKMFLALTLRACIQFDMHRVRSGGHLALDEVFHYIHTHLTEDLTLAHLEQVFFVSRHHLIRQFKLLTGQTVHQYIVKARLDLCRSYIEQGYSITEVYRMGGFGGYNHFFRAFKQAYGLTPMEYYHTVMKSKK